MKLTRENIKETLRSIVREESEYQTFFRKALEKAGKSITDMSDDEKKAFFNKIDAAWDGKGEKNEELVGNQHKLDVDGDGEIEASDLAALRAGKKNERFGRGIEDPAFGDVYQDDIKTISEKISPKDLEAIKGAVESASSFMGVGSELKKLGMKYIFATSPIPIYVVQDKSGNRVGIVNKKYATKPDFVIGDTAIGVMESKVNEYSVNKKFGSKYDIGAGQFPTGTVFWNRAEDEDGDYKKLAHVASNGKITFYDKALPSNVKKHIEDYAKTQKESVNEQDVNWNAVQNAIINFLKANTKILDKRVQAKDTEGVKSGLKSIISGLTNAQRSLKLESVNEIIKTYKPGDGEEVAKIYSGHLTGEKRLSHALTVVDVLHANNLVTKQVAQKMEQELANALARLRKSKSESVNEGRAFVNAAKKAKAEGKTEFEFNGKKYPVTVKD